MSLSKDPPGSPTAFPTTATTREEVEVFEWLTFEAESQELEQQQLCQRQVHEVVRAVVQADPVQRGGLDAASHFAPQEAARPQAVDGGGVSGPQGGARGEGGGVQHQQEDIPSSM